MSNYKQKETLKNSDNIDTVLEYIKKIKDFLNDEKIKDFLEEEFKKMDLLLKEYIEYDTIYYRRRNIIQDLINISNYCSEKINENRFGITKEVEDYLVEKKRQIRLNKIGRIIDSD